MSKVQIIKIRVHPDFPETFQVLFRRESPAMKKKLFSKTWQSLEMELGKFTRYVVDYNSVDKVVINPAIIKNNE